MLMPAVLAAALKMSFMLLPCVVPENIHTSPTEGFFVLHPPLPQEIPVQVHTLLLQFWLLRPPLPLGISNDLPRTGYGPFWVLHIYTRDGGSSIFIKFVQDIGGRRQIESVLEFNNVCPFRLYL